MTEGLDAADLRLLERDIERASAPDRLGDLAVQIAKDAERCLEQGDRARFAKLMILAAQALQAARVFEALEPLR